ncbi:MAG TPA: YbdD/YjiX family protein [Methylophilaceae bacterium]
MKFMHWWHVCRDFMRRLSGDDAYERYLEHYEAMHAETLNPPPRLSRKEFFAYWQEQKWNGVNRCC